MNSLQRIAAIRREYRLKSVQRLLFILIGGATATAGVFFVSRAVHPADSIAGMLGSIFLVGLGLYFLVYALFSGMVIDGTHIEVHSVFQHKSADLSEIEGYRTITSDETSYWQLVLKDGRGKINITRSFVTDDDFRIWLQQIPDLDQRDRDDLLAAISQNAELGASPEERLTAVKEARILNIAAIILAITAVAGLHFATEPFRLPSAVALALIPVAVFSGMLRSPLLYAIFKNKADPRAEMGILLMIAGFGLAFIAKNVVFVSLKPLFPFIVPVAVVYLAAFLAVSRKHVSQASFLVGLLFVSAAYSFGLVVATDTLVNPTSSTYSVSVTGKHTNNDESTTYSLSLAPWGPFDDFNEIRVPASVYSATDVGDKICLGLHPGRLQVPWYQLTDCWAQPDAQTTP